MYRTLSDHCVLTPFTPTSYHAGLQTLTEYLDERGAMPTEADSALIRRDITMALKFLKSKGVLDLDPAEEKIAVQMVSWSFNGQATPSVIYVTRRKATGWLHAVGLV